MDLKFSFAGSSSDHHDHDAAPAGKPLPFSVSPGGATPLGAGSNVLELRVSIAPERDELVCVGSSGDGVSYARASKKFSGEDPAALAAALRSVLARGGAELPEPLIESVSAVVLSLDGQESRVLAELGLMVSDGSAQLATIDEALQARTGLAAGTPIRLAE